MPYAQLEAALTSAPGDVIAEADNMDSVDMELSDASDTEQEPVLAAG